MRLLIISNRPPDPDSGAAGTIWQTNVALEQLGHEVDAIWVDDLGRRRIQHGNLHSLIEQPRFYARAALKAVSRKAYDVVMISQPQGWLAAKELKEAGFDGIVLNRSHGHEIMADRAEERWRQELGISNGSFPFRHLSPVIRKALHHQWTLAIRHFDGFVVPAEDIRRFMIEEQGADAERVRVIHHGLPPAMAERPALPLTPERLRRVLYVGQFHFIKGPNILAQVFSELAKREPQLEFTWVCSKQHHEAARALLEPDVADRVLLEDWRDQESLIDLYDAHGVFVFPSFYEGAGKAALEAMSRGLRVVCSDVGGMRDYVQEAQTGSLVPLGDVGAMTTAVISQSRESSESSSCRFGAGVREKSWRRCAEAIVEFSRSIAEQKSVDAGDEFESQIL